MMSPTPNRVNLLTSKEGQRTQVPEGGELVCYRNEDNQHLFLKVEYSREMMVKLSSSIYCHQRPNGLKEVAEEMPELLGLPQQIPLTSLLPSIQKLLESSENQSNSAYCPYSRIDSPLHLYSPLRGPVTEVDEAMRNFISQRDIQKRLQNMSLPEESISSGCIFDYCETPSICEIRNPQFT